MTRQKEKKNSSKIKKTRERGRNKVNKRKNYTNMDKYLEIYSYTSANRIKREYKDTVFRKLFNDKNNLLSLYNSLNNTNYTDEDMLEVTTLENAIYLNMKNDVSFIIDEVLSLYEHQSTFNPNMPLRGLFYFAQQYDRIVKKENLRIYGEEILQLPTPKYIVFYNGTSKVEDTITLRLSDSFADKEGAAIEIVAKCYNINYGHNKKLLEACKPLMEYSKFIKVVREHIESEMYEDSKNAVDSAIKWCIDNDILRNFLSQNRSEVIELMINELYDYQEVLKRADEEMERIRKEKEEAEQRAKQAEQRAEQERNEKEKLMNSMKVMSDVKDIGLICDNLKKGIEISMIASFLSVDEKFVLKIKELIDDNPDMNSEEILENIRLQTDSGIVEENIEV